MNIFKKNGGTIFMLLFELIVGILLLINPIGFTSGIILGAGILLMLAGIVNVIKYFRQDVQEAAAEQTLVKGLCAAVVGAFCAFKGEWFIVTFPVLTVVYGIVVLITGIGKVQLTVDMLRQKKKQCPLAAINALISIVCAVVILRNPFTTTTVLWMFTGATLIVEGVLDVITAIVRAVSAKKSAN